MVEASEHLLELLTLAEDAGFEIAWAVEHHAHEYYIGPNPLMQLVHWAGHTRRIRLGIGGRGRPLLAPDPSGRRGRHGRFAHRWPAGARAARGAFQYEFDRMLGACRRSAAVSTCVRP